MTAHPKRAKMARRAVACTFGSGGRHLRLFHCRPTAWQSWCATMARTILAVLMAVGSLVVPAPVPISAASPSTTAKLASNASLPVAQAQPQCLCSQIGPFVDPTSILPAAPLATAPTPTPTGGVQLLPTNTPVPVVPPVASGDSPDGTFHVAVTPGSGTFTLDITTTPTGALTAHLVVPDSAQWGFSPDEQRFVYNYLDAGGNHNVVLHNLAGGAPDIPVTTLSARTGMAAIRFSPSGAYLAYAALTSTNQVSLWVVDAAT